eukprot:NODE_47_length_32105_cov_1.240892.p25 type:complete len:155 gc:universal NODE_47_length_32105_cov_1.240892:27389-26925(-)
MLKVSTDLSRRKIKGIGNTADGITKITSGTLKLGIGVPSLTVFLMGSIVERLEVTPTWKTLELSVNSIKNLLKPKTVAMEVARFNEMKEGVTSAENTMGDTPNDGRGDFTADFVDSVSEKHPIDTIGSESIDGVVNSLDQRGVETVRDAMELIP